MALDEINELEIKAKVKEKIIVIGRNIKRLRKEKKITQQDVAFWIFSDKSLISELERGSAKSITLPTLTKIASVMGIHVDDLFCD